jgi:folate-binding protein YgfZ
MIIKLDNRALLKVSGSDAESFLQSQLTNDIFQITPNKIQINAYCQHQGKIMAILWVFIRNDNFYLSFPEDLKGIVLSKLNMFKLMSKVEIEDYSLKLKQYGLIDEKYNESMNIKKNLSLLTTREMLDTTGSICQWEKACIDNSLPEIYRDTSEQFIPQALNLDVNEIGVSFTKGCYPGQEVVARMHYLGKPKRRLFLFSSKCEATIGDSINVKNSKSLKPSGTILRVAKIGGNYYSLGTFEIQHINESANLNNDVNKSLIIVNAK